MAILQNGPNGAIVGKFGSVSAYLLKGQNVVRGGKKKRTSPPTEAELLNREKQKVAGKFAGANKVILEFGYQSLATTGSRVGAFQLAQRHIFKETLELGEDNKPFVNPEKLLLFSGPLNPLANCQVSLDGDRIDLSWTVGDEYRSSRYKINVGLIDIEGESRLKISIANVNQGSCSFEVEGISKKAFDCHVYVGVWDTLKDDFSNSIYCGVI